MAKFLMKVCEENDCKPRFGWLCYGASFQSKRPNVSVPVLRFGVNGNEQRVSCAR